MSSPSSTPMLRQYHAIKADHKDCILFFRLGDFYEMFYEDAKIASRTLDLVLTARGKGSAQQVPMCGFPHHSAQNYISRLIKAGLKVAICEQVEDPATAKGIVKRDVTRVITAGTHLDDQADETRYVLALYPNKNRIGMAFCDPVLGHIHTNEYLNQPNVIIDLISKLPICECVFPSNQEEFVKPLFTHPSLKSKQITLSPFEDWAFNPEMSSKSLCQHFGVHNLNGFGITERLLSVNSSGALLEYLKAMNKQPLKHIDKLSLYLDDEYVYISPAAYKGLELDILITTLDKTLTPMGKRTYRNWFYHPLKNINAIHQRQSAIAVLNEHPDQTKKLSEELKLVGDLEKNLSRLSCGYVHAKDILAIRNTLERIPLFRDILDPLSAHNPLFKLQDIPDLRSFLIEAVNDDIPLSKPEGRIIKAGFNQELDKLRDIQSNGKVWLKSLQEREIKRTGISSLKIGFNKVFGYYIEVSKSKLEQVPEDYIRKQTLANAERYITPELKEYEENILSAEDKILSIESRLIKDIQTRILNESHGIHQFCLSVSTIDALHSLYQLGRQTGYIVPTINDELTIHIENGRHPFVEINCKDNFIANDTLLNNTDQHLVILTGPNMAGKSTYIRQTAILVLMAQIGSPIPASQATIGIVDKIFTRIGAHDDISKGQSTFMVEMNETADILNNLTHRSLVVLDEIGRGTSTYDGLSLAWALAERFEQSKVRTLFATHFHELTVLADEFTGIKNYNVAVKEWNGQIAFLHKIIPGKADDSYGIYVAKLAGVPKDVIKRARDILTRLEKTSDMQTIPTDKDRMEHQLALFTEQERVEQSLTQIVLKEFEDINPLDMTPMQALVKLQDIKQRLLDLAQSKT